VQAWLAPNTLQIWDGGAGVATLGNNLPTVLNNIGISLGPYSDGFSINQNTCGGSLAPGATCTITVGFNLPGENGVGWPGTLIVNDSANNSPQTINLSGNINENY
jgi:hypothetical protein